MSLPAARAVECTELSASPSSQESLRRLPWCTPVSTIDLPVRVFKRPELDAFLRDAATFSEVVFFTSAMAEYSGELLRRIDPLGETVTRLLSRKHCTPLEPGVFAKDLAALDLAALDRPLERVVLVDDTATSFLPQPDNGIPIAPFFGDPHDRSLPQLLPVLREHERRNVL